MSDEQEYVRPRFTPRPLTRGRRPTPTPTSGYAMAEAARATLAVVIWLLGVHLRDLDNYLASYHDHEEYEDPPRHRRRRARVRDHRETAGGRQPSRSSTADRPRRGQERPARWEHELPPDFFQNSPPGSRATADRPRRGRERPARWEHELPPDLSEYSPPGSRARVSYSVTNRHFWSQRGQKTEGEQKVYNLLRAKFPKAEQIDVQDTSGGCGTMYDIAITSEEFRGKKTVVQHRLVNEALGDEAKQIHGFRVKTELPSTDERS